MKSGFINEDGLIKYLYAFWYSYYLATQNRPNFARKLFPCFDEPSFKVPFAVSISRPMNYTTLFNSGLLSSEEMYVILV